MVQSLSLLLKDAGIPFTVKNGRTHIFLPNQFGELQIDALEEDDTIIGLLGTDWHTHADQLLEYGGNSDAENIVRFLREIFAGRLLLIEETEQGGVVRRTIEDDLDYYLKYLPADVEFRIFNKK